MNEPQNRDRSFTHDRYAWRAHVVSRLNRLKNLLTTKWWIPLLGIAIGLGIQGQLWRNEKPLYTSTGRMIVSIKLSIPEGSVYTEELNNFLGTQAALMQSGVVISRAYAAMATQFPDATAKSIPLKVNVLPKTSIFMVQGTGDEPRYTQAFVQASMEEYVNLKKDMRTQTSDTTIAGLTEEVLRLKKELLQCDEDMVTFQSSNSVVLLEEQGTSSGTYLASLNQRLTSLKYEYDLVQRLTLDQNLARQERASSVVSGLGETADAPPVSSGGRTDAEYLKVKQDITLLKAEQEDMAQYLRPKHPKMVALSDEIARRQRLLAIYKQQSADQMEDLKDSLKLQLDNLQKEVTELESKTLEIGRKTAEFQRLKANSQRIQALYDRLLATMQTLDVNKEISPESVNIMEKASTPYPERPNLQKKLMNGALAGLVCALVLLVIIDRLDDSLNSFSEVTDLFDENILGQIPRESSLTSSGQMALLRPEDERHPFLEAYRSLRSSLLFMGEPGQKVPKTVLVTSSVPNDGKSITSANLAITLALSNSRVLLIDGDLRKGSQHSRFEIDHGPGLSEVLSQGLKWTDVVQPTKVPRLFLLPRGAATQYSSELFLSGAIDVVLKEAIAAYDYVVVDSAPVMAADDVTSLAPHVDGVLFVIRAEFTSARVAHAALESLYQRQVRVLGLVFNAIRTSSLDYYHYYKYKDYYGAPSSSGRNGAKLGKKEQDRARQAG